MPSFVGTLQNDTIGAEAASYDVIYALDGNDSVVGMFNPFNLPPAAGSPPGVLGKGMLIEGGAGNDSLAFSSIVYPAVVQVGNDLYPATSAPFGTIHGGPGSDSIYSGAGYTKYGDALYGDEGDDTVIGGVGADLIDGGDGSDRLQGGGGNDQIFAGSGSGDDTLYGQNGNDTLYAGSGNDVLVGGEGNDTIWGGYGFDYMVGDAGDDTIAFGAAGTGQAYGGEGNDTVVGNNAADYMQGDAGNDLLYGFGGNDTIVGGDGSDSLSGGTGTDYLWGGFGVDAFYFNDGGVKAGEFDQVADFQDGVDIVYLQTGTNYTLTDTSLGALLSVAQGSSQWGVYFSGATAAQVSDQVFYA